MNYFRTGDAAQNAAEGEAAELDTLAQAWRPGNTGPLPPVVTLAPGQTAEVYVCPHLLVFECRAT